MKQRNWVIAERLDDNLSQHLLLSRLQHTTHTVEQYLDPSLMDLSNPEAFMDMKAAVERIVKAIHASESIVVWGDFDADGVTSTAIVWETLHQLGASVMPYIPNRDAEGHGFSSVGVQKLLDDGVQLVVTVDHGITAIDEVKALNEVGIDVVVTDHHEPRRQETKSQNDDIAKSPEEKNEDIPQSSTQLQNEAEASDPTLQRSEPFILPEAVAVIHPKLMDNPQSLAGCGVAYLLAYAVWLEVKGLQDSASTRSKFAQDKIELAAIGTIADMVPLRGDNRVLARHGLQALAATDRPGLQQMYRLAGMQDKQHFGAYEVGFGIGPRLNAPGRLGDALESLRLLCTKDALRASQLARDLDNLNKQRQDLLSQVAEEAKAEALKHTDGVFVLAKPHWPAGVCGLAAGKVAESFYRPAVVLENMGEFSRGSARSIAGFDFTAALTQIADLLESYGGHAMAAGFVTKTENLPVIEQRLSDLLWQQFDKGSLLPQLLIDAEVSLSELGWELYTFICQMEPFGMGNPKPMFVSKNLSLTDSRVVGGEGKHLKLTLVGSDGEDKTRMDGIAFGLGYMAESLKAGDTVDAVYQLDENVWQGKRSLQLMVKDLKPRQKTDPVD